MERHFFELLSSAIWRREPDKALFEDITEVEWQEIIALSKRQGVQAIVFESVQLLPRELQPPRAMWIGWIANVDKIERRYAFYEATLAKMVNFFGEADIRVMVLKGLGVAQLYPTPNHREGGDIDVYMFGKHKEVWQLAKKSGLKLGHRDDKHSAFYFDGIPIEDHRTFLNESRAKVDKILNKYLFEIIEKEGVETFEVNGVMVFKPSPTFNAIFLARHMIIHLIHGLVFKQFCDWAVFLEKEHERIDKEFVKQAFSEAGLWELLAIFTNICVELIGMPEKCNFVDAKLDAKIQANILDEVLRVKKKDSDGANSVVHILFNKYKRFKNTIYLRRLVNNSSAFEEYKNTIFTHIKHPDIVLDV